MEILVHAPKDFNNLCVLARTLEVLGVGRCHVFDPHRVIRPSYGKSYTRKLKTVSAGAFFRIEFVPVTASVEFIRDYPDRTIASVPDQTATSLYDFEFSRDDLLVLGSEAHGLPAGGDRGLRYSSDHPAARRDAKPQPVRSVGHHRGGVVPADAPIMMVVWDAERQFALQVFEE